MASTPRVFTIPASARFLPVLIDALMNDKLGLGFKPGRDPLALADVTIYLPTRRAIRLVRESFLDIVKDEAAILPRLVSLNDVDADEIMFAEAAAGDMNSAALELPEALQGLERQTQLARLILKWATRIQPTDKGQAALVAGNVQAAMMLASLPEPVDRGPRHQWIPRAYQPLRQSQAVSRSPRSERAKRFGNTRLHGLPRLIVLAASQHASGGGRTGLLLHHQRGHSAAADAAQFLLHAVELQ